MAAVRSGAWSRRAILRAAGWWESAADELISRHLGWRRDGRTLSLGTAAWLADASPKTPSIGLTLSLGSVHQLDTLVANLITFAALTNRTPVAPHFSCSLASLSRVRQVTNAFSGAGASREPLCAWVPPAECYMLDYLLPTELGQMRRVAPPPAGKAASRQTRRICVQGHTDGWGAHDTGARERIDRPLRRALCDEAQHASLLGNLSHDEARGALRWLKHRPFVPSMLRGDARPRSAWQAATAGAGRSDNVTARCLRKLYAGAARSTFDPSRHTARPT
jgi:hypothetical protein